MLTSDAVVSPVNVLVVDDRPENLLAMESTLTGLGSNLVFVTSARQALRYLLTDDVALILLDVQMPGVNGFELAELIRQREHTQNTPIIFISATSVDEQYVFKGYSLGAVDYLTKPFEPEILKSKVAFFITLFKQNQEIKRQSQLLEEANARLDGLNEDLELRVRNRTAELEEMNRKLSFEFATRNMSETRLALEHTVTRELAAADSIKEAAPEILEAFCRYLGAEMSALWLLDDTGTNVACCHIEVSGPSSPEIERLIGESKDRCFTKGVSLPGHVWERNSPFWQIDSVEGENFPRAKYFVTAGLRSAIGMPIKMGDEFLGVIEFFAHSPIPEEQELLNMFDAIGSEIGQFIHRKRVEAERENLLLQEMALRQQAEKASRLKDEFLATVSHELRTPLNSILGWGQILQRGMLSADKTQTALDTIFRNAKAQSQLIDDLLDMSRLITGNFPLDLAPTEVRSIVEAAVEIVRPNADAKSIMVIPNFRSDVSKITCDAERLQQMVWNLLVNAIKFTPVGGTVEVLVDRNDREIEIMVRDNGDGIAPEFLPHVFDRFRQGDSSSTRAHRGLGLGLAIVTNLAERHSGRVTVASEGLGKGSAFTIVLPLTLSESERNETRVEVSAGDPPQIYEDPLALAGIKILIVDDDTDASQMLSFALQSSGAETRTSSSVSEAFDSLAEWIPNALLTDINMPGEDGYALIRKLRALSSKVTASIPAIALTAMARPEDGDLALSSGFQLHIPKPVNIEDLTEAVKSLVRPVSTENYE
ncbi:MAG: response regulator [Acidobacteriota bacterium]